MLPHVPYSPDLASSDYFLIPNLKKWLGGQIFANNEEVYSAVNRFFEELDDSHNKQGIEPIQHTGKNGIDYALILCKIYDFVIPIILSEKIIENRLVVWPQV